MDKEFHYWMTGIIAHGAGFTKKDARTIAHASQFVDDNDEVMTIRDRNKPKDEYSNYISQTMNILKPRRDLMRIYPVFHFVPDASQAGAARIDGEAHVLDTKPGNANARKMLTDALELPPKTLNRLHRIGIASHAFADTWAHQNFVGWFDDFNGQALNPLPDIGHADFIHHPDWPGHRWHDTRLLDGYVDNNLRFLSAARGLYETYADATGKTNESWTSLEGKLARAMGPTASGASNKGKKRRLEEYGKLAPWLGGKNEYDEHAWLKAAVESKAEQTSEAGGTSIYQYRRYWSKKRQDTDWYQFQEGVKEHQAAALTSIRALVAAGVDAPSMDRL